MAKTGPFDRHSREYGNWFSEHGFVYQSELKAVGHLLPAGGEGLEIGVGSGRFAAPLGIRIGVEPSRAMRTLARSRGIEVHDGVAECLPFPDGRFDYVLMVTTLCFVDDVDRSFQEARRVLRNGGSFVIGFVDRDSPLGAIYQARKRHHPFYREATFYGTAEVLSLLERHGFPDAQVVQTVFGRLDDITSTQDFTRGPGQGSCVGGRAVKGSMPATVGTNA